MIVAADTIGEEVAIAKEGRVEALVGQRPFEMGYKAPSVMIALIEGKGRRSGLHRARRMHRAKQRTRAFRSSRAISARTGGARARSDGQGRRDGASPSFWTAAGLELK